MQIEKLAFDKIGQFSARDVHYQTNPADFLPYMTFLPDMEGLLSAAKERQNYPVDRTLLKEVFEKQYSTIETHPAQRTAIDLISDPKTFTIVTAHQPCLFTGPLYYVTKILSAVKLAAVLNGASSEFNFIPVFINGSEDHDFEEVSSVQLFNKKFTWNTPQTGAVGRMSTEGLDQAIEEVSSVLGTNSSADEIKEILISCYHDCEDYNEYVFKFVNKLLGHTGILMITMDDKDIKKAIVPIIKKEVFEGISHDLVVETQRSIESNLGYKQQAFAREINMFYMSDGHRGRIEKEGNLFTISDSTQTFSLEEMDHEIDNHPENFSPNVITRPLMQEAILPNIAYVGGGGELAYWLERKTQFAAFDIFFPCLIRRNSVMILSKSQISTIEKLGLSVEKLFDQEDDIIKYFLEQQTDVDLNLSEEIQSISKAMQLISEKAEAIDPTLKNAVLAESSKIEKQIEQIEGRIRRSLKKQEETHVNQIKNLKSKLFPGNNGLQERNDNYLQYYVMFGKNIEETLLELLNPLDKHFIILSDQ